MTQETSLNINQIILIGGCALSVMLITSIIHHLVGKITRWWNPKWASFMVSFIIGVIVQVQFIEVIEPIHIMIIIGNVFLIYLLAVGLTTIFNTPIVIITKLGLDEPKDKSKGMTDKASLPAYRETWRTRWFE
jgi:hypothetical protein